jgi:hypothetical protein
MRVFKLNDELYIRCIPSKRLFNSTMVHEVVNRGDVFALRVSDQQLCIIPGTSAVTHHDAELTVVESKIDTVTVQEFKRQVKNGKP